MGEVVFIIGIDKKQGASFNDVDNLLVDRPGKRRASEATPEPAGGCDGGWFGIGGSVYDD